MLTNPVAAPPPKCLSPYDVRMNAGKFFSEVTPIMQFMNFTCTQVKLKAHDDADDVDIIAFDISCGVQWASLILLENDMTPEAISKTIHTSGRGMGVIFGRFKGSSDVSSCVIAVMLCSFLNPKPNIGSSVSVYCGYGRSLKFVNLSSRRRDHSPFQISEAGST
ncbi:hypothetical protein Nepgr_029650 [Nepenthes gracilis]|uniref:Uncharacterized protein n=1 Tax=Nepenthes gracilis TaxID=150966 RepID=A0AAD3Y369_NEPGR|nr:hypothetical protein Nepgr_029650 [Nepenthes gracilis]